MAAVPQAAGSKNARVFRRLRQAAVARMPSICLRSAVIQQQRYADAFRLHQSYSELRHDCVYIS